MSVQVSRFNIMIFFPTTLVLCSALFNFLMSFLNLVNHLVGCFSRLNLASGFLVFLTFFPDSFSPPTIVLIKYILFERFLLGKVIDLDN